MRLSFSIRLQRAISFIAFVPFSWPLLQLVKWTRRCHLPNHAELRAEFKKITRDRTPLLICSNHLTYIDSILIIWALGWHFWYVFNFRCFSWNLPAAEYKKNPFFALVGYLDKCLFVRREGGKNHQDAILGAASALLKAGEVVTIFPEGRRSRSGRFEVKRLTYGVGRILAEVPRCRVLCVYLRSKAQEGYSKYPPIGSEIYFRTRLIEPRTELTGRDGYFDLVRQVGATIQEMESTYLQASPRTAFPDAHPTPSPV